MRDILEMPQKLTQGTIFSNAKSYYFSQDVYGLIISGRCDIENAHFNTFLYLPIIDLKKWFYTFLVPKISRKNAYDTQREIQMKFTENNLSMNALKYIDRNELLNKHFKKSERSQIEKYFEKIDCFNKISSGTMCTSNLKNELSEKELEVYMKEIMRLLDNNFNGFFYLENVDYYVQKKGDQHHFVIILNEVQTLPLEAANCLCDGINLLQNQRFKQYFGNDDYTLALSTVKSPYIEYIIQYYTSLFRIGIDRASIINYDFLFEE